MSLSALAAGNPMVVASFDRGVILACFLLISPGAGTSPQIHCFCLLVILIPPKGPSQTFRGPRGESLDLASSNNAVVHESLIEAQSVGGWLDEDG